MPLARYITMSIKPNEHVRCFGSNSCCCRKNISIEPAIPIYVVATRCRGVNCWPMSVVSYVYVSRCWPMAVVTWSCPELATIAATVATPHRTAAASMNTVCPVACIRTNGRCWSRCCRRKTHKNTSMPAWWITLSCASSSAAPIHTLSSTRTSTATKQPSIAMVPPRRTSRSAKWRPGVARVSQITAQRQVQSLYLFVRLFRCLILNYFVIVMGYCFDCPN